MPLPTPPHLQGCLPTGLERNQQRKNRSEQNERARDVHGHRRGKVCIQRNDRGLLPVSILACTVKWKIRTMTPKTRVAVAVSALPVPRSLAGKISGEIAYSTPYMICSRRQPRW
jgi:hypothetical protein